MAHFEIRGTNNAGKNVKIFIESDSVKNARTKARSQGVIPLSVVQADAQNINRQPENIKQNVASAFKAHKLYGNSKFHAAIGLTP